MADRIRRPKQFEDYLKLLTSDEGVFGTYKDALVFAACLGAKRNKRIEFDKSSEPINRQIFSGNFDEMVINVIAVSEKEDPFIIADDHDDEKVRIFEEYACGGLEIIHDTVGTDAMYEGILQLIMQEETTDNILTEIAKLGDKKL